MTGQPAITESLSSERWEDLQQSDNPMQAMAETLYNEIMIMERQDDMRVAPYEPTDDRQTQGIEFSKDEVS